jgi:hypothetical protein
MSRAPRLLFLPCGLGLLCCQAPYSYFVFGPLIARIVKANNSPRDVSIATITNRISASAKYQGSPGCGSSPTRQDLRLSDKTAQTVGGMFSGCLSWPKGKTCCNPSNSSSNLSRSNLNCCPSYMLFTRDFYLKNALPTVKCPLMS